MKTIPIILSVLTLMACILTNRFPSTSGDMRDLYPRHSEELTALKFSEKYFGSNLFDSIVFPSSAVDEFDLEAIEEDLQNIRGIDQMISPLHVDDTGRNKGFLVKNESGYRFLLRIQNGLTDLQRQKLHSALNHFLQSYKKYEPVRNGSFFISQSLANDIAHETSRLVPLCAALLFLLSWGLFRKLSPAFLVLLGPLLTIVTLACGYAVMNIPLGPVSQLAPPFIITIGTAYSIHLYLFASQHGVISGAILKPILLAAATTSIGLFSLAFLDVKGVTEFALMAGSGNLLAAAYSTCTIAGSAKKLASSTPTGFRFSPPQKPFMKRLVFLLTIFSCVGLYGVQFLSVNTDPETFLISDGNAETSLRLAKKIFSGSRFLSLTLSKINGKKFTDEDIYSLRSLEMLLQKSPEVISLVSPLSALNEQRKLEKFEVDAFSLKKKNPLSSVTDSVIAPGREVVRFVLETSKDGYELLTFANTLSQKMSSSLSSSTERYDSRLSAFELVMASQAQEITKGILWSLLCTLGLVGLILLALSRSFLISLIGLLPNIVPILVVFGAIGLCFQHINLGAALVASAALGIAVDNTFHYILHWISSPEHDEDGSDPVLDLLINPFAYTTLILSLGFSALLFAKVTPTFQFGLLLIITLFIGLLSDITLLPLLLGKLRRRH